MSEPNWIALGGTPGPVGPTGPQGVKGDTGATGPGPTSSLPGDTKVSMQPASHADPAGGMWLLADGSAISGTYTALIALCGANLPDARGRGLVMLGTHVNVNAINKNDGKAVADRQPIHKHGGSNAFAQSGGDRAAFGAGYTFYTTPDTATQMIDTAGYVVIGNLFVHT